jgi:hypothetical protein
MFVIIYDDITHACYGSNVVSIPEQFISTSSLIKDIRSLCFTETNLIKLIAGNSGVDSSCFYLFFSFLGCGETEFTCYVGH